VGERIGVTDEEWAIIGPLLPLERGRWSRPAQDNRRYFEIGVFDALIETLVELVKRDRSADMVDTTIIRAHHCAAGKKGGLKIKRPLAVLAAGSRPKSMPGATAKVGRWMRWCRASASCDARSGRREILVPDSEAPQNIRPIRRSSLSQLQLFAHDAGEEAAH
jgi:hypothetical protein